MSFGSVLAFPELRIIKHQYEWSWIYIVQCRADKYTRLDMSIFPRLVCWLINKTGVKWAVESADLYRYFSTVLLLDMALTVSFRHIIIIKKRRCGNETTLQETKCPEIDSYQISLGLQQRTNSIPHSQPQKATKRQI